MYLAGVEMRDIMFWVPQSGTLGLGISILSYNEKVFFGLMADRRRIRKPNEVIRHFQPEFEKLMYLAMMLPLEGRPSAAQARHLLI
jgi:hypothetical protein